MNQATFRKHWNIRQFLMACAQRGLKGASVWGDGLSDDDIREVSILATELGIRIYGYNRAGPLIGQDKRDSRNNLDLAKKEIDRAAALGADHIMVFTGGLAAGSKDISAARSYVFDAVSELLIDARKANIKLALEPLHPMLAGDRTCITSLRHVNAICDELGDGIGVVVDVYHVWWDEMVKQEIQKLGSAGRILGFHVNDWLVPTKHLLTDRGMMGDGIIDLADLWTTTKEAGFEGPIEVEIFSEYWWEHDPEEVLSIALDRCDKIFI